MLSLNICEVHPVYVDITKPYLLDTDYHEYMVTLYYAGDIFYAETINLTFISISIKKYFDNIDINTVIPLYYMYK